MIISTLTRTIGTFVQCTSFQFFLFFCRDNKILRDFQKLQKSKTWREEKVFGQMEIPPKPSLSLKKKGHLC